MPSASPDRPSVSDRWNLLRAYLRPDPGHLREPWLRRRLPLVAMFIVVIVALVGLNAWLYTCAFAGCPSGSEVRAYRPPEGGRVLDVQDQLIARVQYVRRVNVPLDSVPAHVKNAFLATEDRRFYDHHGVDWRGMARAAVRNVASFGWREGFSTVTMQVARNTFLPPHSIFDRSLPRKLLEMRVAQLLERHLAKDRILELYLNAIYLGNGVYGVEAASRDLFAKRVTQLSVAEGAMLAALPKGPSVYTPRRSAKRALARRNLVLGLMERERLLEPAAAEAARGTSLRIASRGWKPSQANESYALDAVRKVVDSVLTAVGEPDIEVVVYTTIDQTAQRAADNAVRRRAAAIEAGARGRRGDHVEGAMVALDPRTGDIRALVGGRTYVRGTFNRALDARRHPGSAFKPFVYAAALASGFTPASVVEDVPVEVDQGYGATWTPSNYGDEYLGPVTLRRALARSANAATVRLSRAVGEHMVVSVAHRNGIDSPIPVVPAIALGAVEVTPLELVAAYAPFSNGGYRVFPRLVRRIERINGSVIWSSEIQAEEVMDPRDAFQMTSMLRGVIDAGTGSALRAYGVTGPVAGKTGTSNDAKNVWFVGYTPTIVAGFWFGFDTPQSLGGDANGGRLAAPAWAQFYLEGWRERGRDWPVPEGLVARTIDMETGYLAGEFCPLKQREWFKIGTEPTEYCLEHEYPAWDSWFSDTVDTINGAVDSIRRRYEDVMGRRRSTDTLGRRPDTTRRPTDSIGQLKQLLNKLRKPPE